MFSREQEEIAERWMEKRYSSREQEKIEANRPQMNWSDVLAFMIAAFQILIPFAAVIILTLIFIPLLFNILLL